jgi:transposase
MRTDYPTVIRETSEELAALERRLRGRPGAVRVRMLRFLKSGTATSLGACVPLLGYSPRHLARWWATYRTAGLAALLQQRPRGGSTSRLTPAALADLKEQLRSGHLATLADIQRYLAEQHGIVYTSLNGVWCQLRKHRIKLKTGRRRHRQADAAVQEAFRAGFRGDPGRGQGAAGLRL